MYTCILDRYISRFYSLGVLGSIISIRCILIVIVTCKTNLVGFRKMSYNILNNERNSTLQDQLWLKS